MHKQQKSWRNGLKRLLLATAAVSTVFLTGGAALAQAPIDRDQNVSVSERARPDYDPTGIQAGAFILKPRLSAEVAQVSNVFATETNEQSDTVATFTPEIEVSTTWSRNALRLRAGFNDRHYADAKSERRTDEFVDGEFRLDVFGETTLTVGGSFSNYGEARTSADLPVNAAKPTDVDEGALFVRGSHTINRVRVSAGVRERRLDFDPVQLRDGSFVDTNERDRRETRFGGRVEYAISPRTAVFADVAREQRRYKQPAATAPAVRDSDVDEIGVGVNFDISALARGEITVGQFEQEFKDSSIPGTSGLFLNGRAEWFPQEMTTVTATVSRNTEETSVTTASSSSTVESVGLRVDHELQRNVLLFARASTGSREFLGIQREDRLTGAGAGVRYLVNREVEIVGSWGYERQKSSGSNRDRNFDSNTVSIALVLRR